MATITFDTLKYVERLKAAGVPEAQAKAESEALRDVLAEATDNTLATKSDIERVERKLIEHDGEFKAIKWMLGIIVGGVVMLVLRAFFPA
jgi:hypothetical protein